MLASFTPILLLLFYTYLDVLVLLDTIPWIRVILAINQDFWMSTQKVY